MPFKYYIIYMKPLYRQNSHYIGKSTTSRLTYRLVTKSVPCRLTDLKTLLLCHFMQLEFESSTLLPPIFTEDQMMRDKLQRYEPL
jgi:hypothetical protein